MIGGKGGTDGVIRQDVAERVAGHRAHCHAVNNHIDHMVTRRGCDVVGPVGTCSETAESIGCDAAVRALVDRDRVGDRREIYIDRVVQTYIGEGVCIASGKVYTGTVHGYGVYFVP